MRLIQPINTLMKKISKKPPKNPSKKETSAQPLIILFNKPFNCLCQFTGGEGRKTLADYIPVPDVYAAGRLDYDSEGLVLLTNMGDTQHFVTDPRHKLPKTYLVQVEGTPDSAAIERLKKGVLLKDGMTRPAEAEVIGEDANIRPRSAPIRFRKNIPATWLKLTIFEGRNRQVRRMTASIGHPCLRLVRIQIGQWKLGEMKPGEWKEADSTAKL